MVEPYSHSPIRLHGVVLERLGKLKYPITSLGFKPATSRLVALFVNLLRYRVSRNNHSVTGEFKVK
jgi:hypothetical protein